MGDTISFNQFLTDAATNPDGKTLEVVVTFVNRNQELRTVKVVPNLVNDGVLSATIYQDEVPVAKIAMGENNAEGGVFSVQGLPVESFVSDDYSIANEEDIAKFFSSFFTALQTRVTVVKPTLH